MFIKKYHPRGKLARDKKWLINLLYIFNNKTSNFTFCRLQLVVEGLTNKTSFNSTKLLSQRIRKRYYKLWELL